MRVFFYGLFMDQRLLAAKGITPCEVKSGFVEGYNLCIGERATLVCCEGGRVYGVMMDIAVAEAAVLYAEKSVADYLPEPVVVALMDGGRVDAVCYNLASNKVTGTNKEYAKRLLAVAARLGFPDSYLAHIMRAQA